MALELTRCKRTLRGDFAASCCDGLSHTAKVEKEESIVAYRSSPHSDFRLYDARIASLQSPSVMTDTPL